MCLMALTYIAGALIYGCRFPERVLPGKFNYFVSNVYIFSFDSIVLIIGNLGLFSSNFSYLCRDCVTSSLFGCFKCYGFLA
jgi:predicted membrane channel-forming protein YqfA (hemolysin III family)